MTTQEELRIFFEQEEKSLDESHRKTVQGHKEFMRIMENITKGKAMNNRLHEIRKGKGLTQNQLVALSGVSRSTIAKIENDRVSNPGMETAQRLAKALDTTIDELFPKD